MKFSAILFDLDGTLVDSESVWLTAEQDFLRRRGKVYDPVLHAATHGTAALESMNIIRRIYGIEDEAEAILNEVTTQVKALLKAHSVAKPGAAEILHYVKSHQLPRALVSNSSHEIIEVTLQNHPWASFLELRCSADDVKNPKPAPDLYLYAAQKLGIPPQECLVIEDSRNGAKAAVAAGATCFAVPDSQGTLDFTGITDHVFGDLRQVLDAIRADRKFSYGQNI